MLIKVAKIFNIRVMDKEENEKIFRIVENIEKDEDEYYRNRYIL